MGTTSSVTNYNSSILMDKFLEHRNELMYYWEDEHEIRISKSHKFIKLLKAFNKKTDFEYNLILSADLYTYLDPLPIRILMLPTLHYCLSSWDCDAHTFINLCQSYEHKVNYLGVDYLGNKVNLFEYANNIYNKFEQDKTNPDLSCSSIANYSSIAMNFQQKYNYLKQLQNKKQKNDTIQSN